MVFLDNVVDHFPGMVHHSQYNKLFVTVRTQKKTIYFLKFIKQSFFYNSEA